MEEYGMALTAYPLENAEHYGIILKDFSTHIQKSFDSLSKRELETLENLMTGKSILEISEKVILFDTHFVKNTNITPFLNDLEENAKLHNVKIEISNIDSLLVEEEKQIFLNFNISGTFSNIYKYLLYLENSKYELEIHSVRLLRDSVGEDNFSINPNWKANFRIRIISFIEE